MVIWDSAVDHWRPCPTSEMPLRGPDSLWCNAISLKAQISEELYKACDPNIVLALCNRTKLWSLYLIEPVGRFINPVKFRASWRNPTFNPFCRGPSFLWVRMCTSLGVAIFLQCSDLGTVEALDIYMPQVYGVLRGLAFRTALYGHSTDQAGRIHAET